MDKKSNVGWLFMVAPGIFRDENGRTVMDKKMVYNPNQYPEYKYNPNLVVLVNNDNGYF